jgi:glycosyltransferase involved in cell wall biosynthesis
LAVESVCGQTFADWELIIADDGSDAETRAFLAGLAKPSRIRVLELSHTGNPSAVRNAALREARGEYVAFLDSDDVWMPRKLELQVAGLRASPACRWCYTGWVLIDEAGKTRASSPKTWVPYRGAILEKLLTLEATVATAAVLVERSLLAQVGGFDEQLPMFEDYDLWMRLAARSEVALIDQPLICVRLHDEHYSRVGIPMVAGRYRLLAKVLARATDPRTLRLVERSYAQSALDLAGLYADTSRVAALKALVGSCAHSIRHLGWWKRVPRVLLKIAAPRPLLALYRARRVRTAASA